MLCFLYLGVGVHRETCVSERDELQLYNLLFVLHNISLLWTDYVFSFLSIRLINDQSDSRKRGLSKPTQFMPGLKKVKHCRHPVDLPRRSNHEKGEKTIQFQPYVRTKSSSMSIRLSEALAPLLLYTWRV